MEIGKVKADIKSKTFDDFYIFAGEDIEILKLYIDKIAEAGNFVIEYVDAVSTIYQKARMKSLISRPTLYVVFDDMEFMKSEKAWDVIKKLKDDVIIFQYSTVDKRLKFWKFFQNRAVIFEHLDTRILMHHLKNNICLSEKNLEKLIEICENDYGRCLLEIDKIKSYMHGTKIDNRDIRKESYPDSCFRRLLEDGTIYQPPKDAIFDFVSAVLDRKPKKAYELLEDCYGVGEADMTLLSVLYDNFRNLLQVQTCTSDSISESTGLNGFQIKNVRPFVDRYTDDELVEILKLLREIEKGIKVGEISDELSVHYALVNIF